MGSDDWVCCGNLWIALANGFGGAWLGCMRRELRQRKLNAGWQGGFATDIGWDGGMRFEVAGAKRLGGGNCWRYRHWR